MPGGGNGGAGNANGSNFGGSLQGGPGGSGNGGGPGGGMIMGGSNGDDSSRMNQEKITLSEDDVDDLKTFLPGISKITISYNTKSDVEGGDLDDATGYTIAGVKHNYASMSNLSMAVGDFISSSDEENKEKVCVLLVEQRHLALIDPVRVYHNAALLLLTENVRQTYRGDYPALQDVA